jgi:hypothetical protein
MHEGYTQLQARPIHGDNVYQLVCLLFHKHISTNVSFHKARHLSKTKCVVFNRAILYCPFVPFSILFTRAVQLSDVADLDRLDRFAASLQSDTTPPEAITHPYRLYMLLCKAARLYFDLETPSWPADPAMLHNMTDVWAGFDRAQSGGAQTHGLYDWSYDSQRVMELLSEDALF